LMTKRIKKENILVQIILWTKQNFQEKCFATCRGKIYKFLVIWVIFHVWISHERH
jgi:hypothetical protein